MRVCTTPAIRSSITSCSLQSWSRKQYPRRPLPPHYPWYRWSWQSCLLKTQVLGCWPMELFVVEDGLFRIDGFEFGLEWRVASGSGKAVGAAAWLGRIIGHVFELGHAKCAPIAFAAAMLLADTWRGVGVVGFAKEAWKMLLWRGCAIGKANVVTVANSASASHFDERCVLSMGNLVAGSDVRCPQLRDV